MKRKTATTLGLGLAGTVLIAGCTAGGGPAVPPTTSPQTTPGEAVAPMENSRSQALPTEAPAFIGLPWPQAASQASAAGLAPFPNFAGPPGPLGPQCIVVQQSPLPGEALSEPMVQMLVQCPSGAPSPPSPPSPAPTSP